MIAFSSRPLSLVSDFSLLFFYFFIFSIILHVFSRSFVNSL